MSRARRCVVASCGLAFVAGLDGYMFPASDVFAFVSLLGGTVAAFVGAIVMLGPADGEVSR